MLRRVAKRKLQAVEVKAFPAAWITFIRKFKKLRNTYGEGGNGFADYADTTRGKTHQTGKSTVTDTQYHAAVNDLDEPLEILNRGLLKAIGDVGKDFERGKVLVSLKVELNHIKNKWMELKRATDVISSPKFVMTTILNLESNIRKAAGVIDLIYQKMEKRKKDQR
ncbi:hypothetical protein HY495_02920 [Candidatus Woesearchaeota archaeon]|nr:hypothetical protein [Candidatus Woesearchaeota archaeon]